jgi:RNA polymerase sigma-70 factor (ECF subfamily)
MSEGGTTFQINLLLGNLPDANSEEGRRIRDELIRHSQRRMEELCRKMFFPSLRGTIVDREDIYQEAALRLWHALQKVQPPSARDFFALAATEIRRVLVEQWRKWQRELPPPDRGLTGSSSSASKLILWTEFHEQVEKLPEPLREVFDLLWYHDLSQKEAAALLAVDESTVKRRFRRAKVLLVDVLPADPTALRFARAGASARRASEYSTCVPRHGAPRHSYRAVPPHGPFLRPAF